MLSTGQLRLQLLSTAQDERVLDLFRFLDPLVSWSHVKPRVRLWARGWVKGGGGRAVRTTDALLKVLSQHAANEIEVAFKVRKPYRLGKSDLSVQALTCVLQLSPTNSIWAPVAGYQLATRAEESRRASFESRELSLKWNEISACPTLLEAAFSVGATTERDELLRSFWDVLPVELPAAEVWKTLFGCADLSAFHFRGDVLQSLAPWPRAYESLGLRFDDLHPIMLGSLTICEQLAGALGDSARVRAIQCASPAHSIGAVWLPMSVVSDSGARVRAERWLVRRDSSTKPLDVQESRGEFRVGSHVFYTQRRMTELQANGRLPTLPPGFLHFPLVASKYCLQLGIDPEDMLVELWQEPLIAQAQRDIDRAFEALPRGLPLISRVWQAHETTYKKWLYGADERLDFVRERLLKLHAIGKGSTGGMPAREV